MGDKKNILILGATGPTGILTLRTALERGHTVTIYARSPQKIPEDLAQHSNLKIVPGELDSTETLAPLLTHTDAIISLLGPTSPRHTGTPISDFYRRLLTQLRSQPQPPYVLALGTLSIPSAEDSFSLLCSLLVNLVWLLAHGAWNEFVTLGRTFGEEGHGVPWTVFRVAVLTGGEGVGDARAGFVGSEGWGVAMPRADLAGWLVREVEVGQRRWVGKMPAMYRGVKARGG